MGAVYHGIPSALALRLKEQYNLRFFVETGTLIGNTAKWASENFDDVYTIECSEKFYIISKDRIGAIPNVRITHGFSQYVLDGILSSLTGPALIWLDAHWSPDLKYRHFDQIICPVLDEIEIISTSDQGHVILIDDFRLFGKESGWPSFDKVKKALEKLNKRVTYSIDVIMAVPDNKDLIGKRALS